MSYIVMCRTLNVKTELISIVELTFIKIVESLVIVVFVFVDGHWCLICDKILVWSHFSFDSGTQQYNKVTFSECYVA